MEPQDLIQQLYIAYYGRPADPGGMEYWAGRLSENGNEMGEMLNAFANSDEFADRFGSLNEQDLVNNLYEQILGRSAEDVGLAFYTDMLERGDSSLIKLALDITNGAQGDDITVTEKRVEVAQAFTQGVSERDLSYGTIEAAVQLMAQVTANTNVNEYIQSAVNERLDTLAAADGAGGSGGGSITPTFSVSEETGTLQFDGTATGAITFTLTADTVTAERQGVMSELKTTTADLKGVNLPADTEVKIESGTLTLTAAQASGRTIGGESTGSVIVTALAEKADADLSNITVNTTLPLAENDDFAFTGEFNTDADITVEMNGDNSVDLSSMTSNVVIALNAAVAFSGSFASGGTVNVTGDHAFDITALAIDDLPNAFDLDGTDLIVTAEQAHALTVTGASSVTVQDLDDTPDANLSGIAANLPLTLDLGTTTTVDFTGQINTADLTIMGGNVALNVTDAAAFTAENVAVKGTAALVVDGSQISDINNVSGDGIFDLRGGVQADEFLAAQLGTFAQAGGFAKLADANSLQGSAQSVLDVIDAVESLNASDIDITVSPAVSVAQAQELAAIATEGEVNFSVKDGLTSVLSAATSGTEAVWNGLAEADSIFIDDLESGEDEEISFNTLPLEPAAMIDFVDDEATLTQEELFKITGTTPEDQFNLALTAGDGITVTGVTESNFEAVTDELTGNNDTVDLAEAVTLTATDFKDAFEAKGISATAGDDITVTGTAANDSFDISQISTEVTITGFEEGDLVVLDADTPNLVSTGVQSYGGDSGNQNIVNGVTIISSWLGGSLDDKANVAGKLSNFSFANNTDVGYFAVTYGSNNAIYLADASGNGDLNIDAEDLTLIGTVEGLDVSSRHFDIA